jgi:hypothetical protein
MLKTCSKALLLSGVKSFIALYKQLAEEMEIELRAEAEWHSSYRVKEDVIICGTKYLEDINKAYYPITVLILKSGESFIPYAKKGISRFIFDYNNQYELAFALMRPEEIVLHASSNELKAIIKESALTSYQMGEYQFFFDKNRFLYKGKPIYLAESAKRYLAEWLLNGHKDNKKRMVLFNLRKRFGDEFLRDVDRFGQIKEETNE